MPTAYLHAPDFILLATDERLASFHNSTDITGKMRSLARCSAAEALSHLLHSGAALGIPKQVHEHTQRTATGGCLWIAAATADADPRPILQGPD